MSKKYLAFLIIPVLLSFVGITHAYADDGDVTPPDSSVVTPPADDPVVDPGTTPDDSVSPDPAPEEDSTTTPEVAPVVVTAPVASHFSGQSAGPLKAPEVTPKTREEIMTELLEDLQLLLAQVTAQ